MIKISIIVNHKKQIKNRTLALLVQKAKQFSSKLYLQMGNNTLNIKSIMEMLSLMLWKENQVILIADGED